MPEPEYLARLEKESDRIDAEIAATLKRASAPPIPALPALCGQACDQDVTFPDDTQGILVCDNDCKRLLGHAGEHDCWQHNGKLKEASKIIEMLIAYGTYAADRNLAILRGITDG